MIRLLCLILSIGTCFLCNQCLGHTGIEHYREFSIVFNGYGGKEFEDLCNCISVGIDKDLPDAFRKCIGAVPGNHRILGHGWTLDADIPKETLDFLEKAYPGKRKAIIKVWSQFAKDIKQRVRLITGLPPKQADALVSMIYDLHLLGDWEPGNVVTEYILPPKEIAKHFSEKSKILFQDRPEVARSIKKSLKGVAQRKLSPDIMAKSMIDNLARCEIGKKLHAAHPKLNILFSENFIKSAEEKFAVRILERVPGGKCDPSEIKSRIVIKKDFSQNTLQKISRVPGLLTPDGRLLVSLKTGSMHGLTVFAIDGGIASYSYVKGEIYRPEFQEELIDAAIKGVAVGTAVAVSVLLGSNPGGLIVLAVSILTYEITNFIIKEWHENQKRKYLTLKDLEPFGIKSDTTLDIELDTPLVIKPDTPLVREPVTTLDIEPDTIL